VRSHSRHIMCLTPFQRNKVFDVPERGDPSGPCPTDNFPRQYAVFQSFARRIGDAYRISLPDPQLKDFSSLKKFCSGLLLPSSAHPWARPIKGLRLRDRLSIAGSLFLFRKILPASTPSLSAYVEKMTSEAPPPADGYISFISSELNKMFPVGWDKGYSGAVHGTCLRTSATLESSRREGGCRGLLLKGWDERAEFVKSALDKYASPKKGVNVVRAAIARCAGKDRIVTVNSADMSYLTPYHTVMYNHISKQKWCLRGEATREKFKEFTQKQGEVFVSGDYESATDNLNLDVARHILSTIARRCSHVPLWIRDLGASTLETTLMVGDPMAGYSFHTVRRGQMMGNALSFPLLCLQNYLAFKFSVRREVPVKINGDDIVFRATVREYQDWANNVSRCGLTLSLGKTAVNRNWFSLNSTFFVAGSKRVRLAPVIRSTALFGKPESLSAIAGQWDTLRGFRGRVGEQLRVFFLGTKRRWINGSQLSLTRGLGVSASKREIFRAGLAERESFYRALLPCQDQLRETTVGYFRCAIPEGWRRVSSRDPVDQEEQRRFSEALVAQTWTPELADPPRGRSGLTCPFVAYPRRGARLLRLSGRQIHRLATRFAVFYKEKGAVWRWVWTDTQRELSARAEDVSFADLDLERGDGYVVDWMSGRYYDFRSPPSSAFPSSFHTLT